MRTSIIEKISAVRGDRDNVYALTLGKAGKGAAVTANDLRESVSLVTGVLGPRR